MPEDLQNFEYQRSWVIGEDPETAFPTLNYLKNWKSSSDFITYQPSETQVRADMQELFDEIKAYINGDFKAYVVATGNAENIRVENEAARVANEQARVNNEQTRIANEETRITNEETRITNETTRQTQEQARQDAEAARASENDGIVARATAQANTAAEKATVATEMAGTATEKAAVAAEKATVATEKAAEAAASATNANTDAQIAQSYAVGSTGTRAGEDTDNAKYYCAQAKSELTELWAAIHALERRVDEIRPMTVTEEQDSHGGTILHITG